MDKPPNTAARLQRERRDRGWSQKELARRIAEVAGTLGVTMPQRQSLIRSIANWEAGKHTPRDPYPMLIARAFSLDENELLNVGPSASSVATDLLGGTALLPAFAPNGRPVDGDYVTSLREAIQALVTLDGRYGGNELVPITLRIFRSSNAKLVAGNFVPHVEHDLEAAISEIGEVAAWLAHDADQQELSRQIIQEALMLARLAGDRVLELFELAHLSMLSIYQQRPREALRIAQDVLDRGGLPPRVVAIFNVRRGRALANLGDRTRALDAIRSARSALADGIGSRDPYWTWWMDEGELAHHEGMAHAELGEWQTAVTLLADARAQRLKIGRGSYHYAAQFLNALVHVQAWEEAEPVIDDATDLSREVGSKRTANLLLRTTHCIESAGSRASSTLKDAALDLRRALSI